MKGGQQPVKQKRTRTRIGCYTCRRRKKLCDNLRPTCGSCNRLGIPCVFPQLQLTPAGELVQVPQPNGWTKIQPEASSQLVLDGRGIPSSAGESNPGTTGVSHVGSNIIAQTMAAEGVSPSSVDPNATLFELLSTLPAPAPDPTPFAQSLNDNTAFDIDLPDSFMDLPDTLGEIIPNSSSQLPPSVPEDPSRGSSQMSMADLYLSPQPSTGISSIAATPASSVDNVSAIDQALLMQHLPTLLNHFVNTYSQVVSVLGSGQNSFTSYLMPLASRSQLVLWALVGWAASHLSFTGEPYASLANTAVKMVEQEVRGLEAVEDMGEEQQEESMLALLILGGIYVYRGDVTDWVKRLPQTRRILRTINATSDVGTSETWRSIALNLVYHDTMSSLATCQLVSLPFDFYQQILLKCNSSPDIWMGATMRVFGLLGETAVLASEISTIAKLPPTRENDWQLDNLLCKQFSLVSRLRRLELPLTSLSADQLHLLAGFEIWKLATELYLRQAINHYGSSDLCSRGVARHILNNLRNVLGTPSETHMLFPLFIAGVSTVDPDEREKVAGMFSHFKERARTGNIQTVYSLLLEVWKRDKDGDRFVDWRAIADESDTMISFA
ncbi:hypothetical protein CspHIS471_0100090 [Cutaneotrichosporon sp. HIS471]|nr:hypothetical protein CspHIS471_0100090 [Cutaneotrichosporon sp. HIS471]